MVCADCEVSRTGAIVNTASKTIQQCTSISLISCCLPLIRCLGRGTEMSVCSSVAPWLTRDSAKKGQTESGDTPRLARQNRATGRMRLDVCGPDYRLIGRNRSLNSKNSSFYWSVSRIHDFPHWRSRVSRSKTSRIARQSITLSAKDRNYESGSARVFASETGRDARFDGKFFIGVLTTRIYCRPACRARTSQEKM